MIANALDFRKKMKNILKALDSNETVTILYHGKERGTIVPVTQTKSKELSVVQHPFFGMIADCGSESVERTMENLRGTRY